MTTILVAGGVGILVGGSVVGIALATQQGETQQVALVAEQTTNSDEKAEGSADEHDSMMQMSEVSSEFGYLVDMIPHHQEAIDNAQLLVDYSDRQEMRDFGATIIETQSAEVEQMKAWLKEWYPGRDTTSDYMPMMGDLSELRGDELDQEFLETMIPHHMMAVMMSQQLVNAGIAEHEALVPFAENIRDVQHKEIFMMRDWLGDWFDVQYPMGAGMHGEGHRGMHDQMHGNEMHADDDSASHGGMGGGMGGGMHGGMRG